MEQDKQYWWNKYKRALTFINIFVDYLKDTGKMEHFLLYATSSMLQGGYKQEDIVAMFKEMTTDAKEIIHGKQSR